MGTVSGPFFIDFHPGFQVEDRKLSIAVTFGEAGILIPCRPRYSSMRSIVAIGSSA
jgi:hypothetical protein